MVIFILQELHNMVIFIFNILLKNIAVSAEEVLVKLLDYYNIKWNDCKLYGKKASPLVL